MYLLYLDGSGTPDVVATDHANFVLLGLAIHEGSWFALERRVAALKTRYQLPGVPLELHCLAICSTIREQDLVPDFATLTHSRRRTEVLALRAQKLAQKPPEQRELARKRYRHTDPVIHLTRAERSTLYESALDLVGAHHEIRLFAEVVNKQHLLRMTGKRNAVGPAFEQVLSRFDALLQFLARAGGASANHGIAVVDNDPHSDLMRDLTLMFRASGHQWGSLQHVIETPFFVDSKMVSGIQLADVCAYALRRYVAKDGRAGSHEEKQFLRIFHKFDRAGPKLHGLRHYCSARTCDCLVCQERGHA